MITYPKNYSKRVYLNSQIAVDNVFLLPPGRLEILRILSIEVRLVLFE